MKKILYEILAIVMLFLGAEGVMRLCDLYEKAHPRADVWSSLFITLYMVLFAVFLFMSWENGKNHGQDE